MQQNWTSSASVQEKLHAYKAAAQAKFVKLTLLLWACLACLQALAPGSCVPAQASSGLPAAHVGQGC